MKVIILPVVKVIMCRGNNLNREKEIRNRIDCQRSEKKIQNSQKIKDNAFLIGLNRTKRAHLKGSPLVHATYNLVFFFF